MRDQTGRIRLNQLGISREGRWSKEIFFVFACVGAAVGLGNLWRFPYMAYKHGGGAFIIPYLICLLGVGVPLVLLEIRLGRWGGGSVARAFQKAGSQWTWIGWWALINSMVIVFYYAVVLSWCVLYFIYSFSEAWGDNPASFFVRNVLGLTGNPFTFGGIRATGVLALLVVWLGIFLIVRSGTRGLSKILMITVPLPLVLLVILAVRSIGLPGSANGLAFFLKPRMSEIWNVSVWAAASSQVVLSLGLGMGQVIAYAARRRRDSGTVKAGLWICGLDVFFSVLAGLTVFATMGYLASSQGVAVGQLKIKGLFLAFVSYPAAISSLPMAPVWGVIFFLLLIMLGIDSAFAVIEANLAGCEESTKKKTRTSLAALLCAIGFVGGLLFTTSSGLIWLDIVDHWVANYSIAAIIILECIVFSFFVRSEKIRNDFSALWPKRIELFWRALVAVIVPASLLLVFGANLIKEFVKPYGGYPSTAIIVGGWCIFLAMIIIGILVGTWYNRRTK